MSGGDRPVRVLVVDDTRTIRAMIRAVLEADGRFEVVGEAGDPYVARDLIKTTAPDVLTLDVEMPRMNGLVFLRNLMRLRPMPVVMVSTRTSEQSEEAISALSLGAVDCIDLSLVHGAPDIRARLTETLLAAAGASLRRLDAAPRGAQEGCEATYRWRGGHVLIGSSTGGVDALERLFSVFPENCPPTFVAQHMPASFLASFARRLNDRCAPTVMLAEDGMRAKQGCIYFAPGGAHHLEIAGRDTLGCRLRADDGKQLHVPSVDLLFNSAVRYGARITAAVLTGMGRDGADGLLRLRNAGARTVAQDAATAVIDGMPGAAREIGAAEIVLPIDEIGGRLLELCGSFAGATA